SYQISNHANGDIWNNIFVIYNAKTKAVNFDMDGAWRLAVLGDKFYFDGMEMLEASVEVPPLSMFVAFQK
ncbi:MAG: pullulanase, partial [Ulvibacter sp.]